MVRVSCNHGVLGEEIYVEHFIKKVVGFRNVVVRGVSRDHGESKDYKHTKTHHHLLSFSRSSASLPNLRMLNSYFQQSYLLLSSPQNRSLISQGTTMADKSPMLRLSSSPVESDPHAIHEVWIHPPIVHLPLQCTLL